MGRDQLRADRGTLLWRARGGTRALLCRVEFAVWHKSRRSAATFVPRCILILGDQPAARSTAHDQLFVGREIRVAASGVCCPSSWLGCLPRESKTGRRGVQRGRDQTGNYLAVCGLDRTFQREMFSLRLSDLTNKVLTNVHGPPLTALTGLTATNLSLPPLCFGIRAAACSGLLAPPHDRRPRGAENVPISLHRGYDHSNSNSNSNRTQRHAWAREERAIIAFVQDLQPPAVGIK